ncbi:MAG: thiamine ABC transporter substrate-binding protein [Candidatus Heimdallarchaeota archaeon]|nr:thiamine ABC transporter substrate-binding protein [Candidatus Heimdallarchaeota archaeon]MCK4877131.1 thiamine ABC transporter substrate-binding protein [Candidatus Heimdallarchaeota archaeon]
MMRKLALASIFLCLFISILNSQVSLVPVTARDYELVIYTYESLLADPGYDFVGGFSNYSGVPKEDIRLVLLDDANTVVSQAVLEKDNPNADVLIGIDNVLIHTAKREGILKPYSPSTLENIDSDLIANLDPENYVVPYDYGIIALWYDRSRINDSSNPELTSLTLQDIIDYNLDELLIVEDPTLSSPGLGFLLWTIAVFGDPEINFDGLLAEDWRAWWKEASDDLRIAASWGAAFDLYATEEENRPIMVSYGTSPAYDVCHPLWGVGYGNSPPSKAIVSHEEEMENAWLQIEGIGLVKNAPHENTAKQFIDWFLSTDLQDNIAMNNWMYPANTNADISTCFSEIAINPNDVDILNDLLPPSMIEENLADWKSDWEAEIAPFSSLFALIVSLIFAATSYSLIKQRK